VPAHWSDAIEDDPLVHRFHDICLFLLNRNEPLYKPDIARAARSRAKELGLHVEGEIDRPLLSVLVNRRFNSQWLESVAPGLGCKKSCEYWRRIDGIVQPNAYDFSGIAYALAVSVLFDSDTQALNAISSAAETTFNKVEFDNLGNILDAICRGLSLEEACKLYGLPIEDMRAALRTMRSPI
jgi:hypothetical protein